MYYTSSVHSTADGWPDAAIAGCDFRRPLSGTCACMHVSAPNRICVRNSGFYSVATRKLHLCNVKAASPTKELKYTLQFWTS